MRVTATDRQRPGKYECGSRQGPEKYECGPRRDGRSSNPRVLGLNAGSKSKGDERSAAGAGRWMYDKRVMADENKK